jgi:cobalt/nickel transport system permease protein
MNRARSSGSSARRSFVERNLERFALLLQESVFAEETAQKKGWLQQMDARVKCAGLLLLLLASSISRNAAVIVCVYSAGLLLAAGSHVFSASFLRRVWFFMPFYTALMAAPALVMTPGEPLWRLPGMEWAITRQGANSVMFLVLRVATSVSLMLLLVLTTSWPRLLKALRSLGFPQIMILLLMMTYRYIYVLLSAATALFLARKSRRVGPETWRNSRQWLGGLLGALLEKSYHLSQEVYLAMISRGFRGEPILMDDFRLAKRDYLWAAAFLAAAAGAFYFGFIRIQP